MLADIISYNSAISACERGGQWAMALWLLELLQEEKFQGDLITYNAAISALKNQVVSVMQWGGCLVTFFLCVSRFGTLQIGGSVTCLGSLLLRQTP